MTSDPRMSQHRYRSVFSLVRSLWRFSVTASLPLALGLLSTSTSVAQETPQPFFSNGPGASTATPQFYIPQQTFQIDSGVTCPTPSLNVTGFAGTANDFANTSSVLRASSNSGLNNYGVTVGINIPLGGDLSKFCRDYAASRTTFERRRVENQSINAQVNLIEQCQLLYDMGFRFDNKTFDDEQFASIIKEVPALSACSSLSALFDNKKPPRVTEPTSPPDKTPDKGEESIAPFSPEPLRVLILD